MNPISVNQFSTYRWSLFEDVLQYSKTGFSSIGLWRTKIDDFGQLEALDLLHEMKMSVSSVHWAGGFTGGDGHSFESALEDAKDAIRFASEASAKCLIVHPGSRNGHTNKHACRLMNAALEALVPFAMDFDISLALEPMSAGSFRQWTFVDGINQALELISDFPASSVGIVLDLFHVGDQLSILDELPTFADRIKLVQVADTGTEISGEDNRCLLGSGHINIPAWTNRLTELGYDGPFEIELHGYDMEGIEYSEMLRASHAYLTQCLSHPKIESIE